MNIIHRDQFLKFSVDKYCKRVFTRKSIDIAAIDEFSRGTFTMESTNDICSVILINLQLEETDSFIEHVVLIMNNRTISQMSLPFLDCREEYSTSWNKENLLAIRWKNMSLELYLNFTFCDSLPNKRLSDILMHLIIA